MVLLIVVILNEKVLLFWPKILFAINTEGNYRLSTGTGNHLEHVAFNEEVDRGISRRCSVAEGVLLFIGIDDVIPGAHIAFIGSVVGNLETIEAESDVVVFLEGFPGNDEETSL